MRRLQTHLVGNRRVYAVDPMRESLTFAMTHLQEPRTADVLDSEVAPLPRGQRMQRKLGALLFSILFISIPWYTWRPKRFRDVDSYLARIELLRWQPDLHFDQAGELSFIFSEPLWTQILIFIGDTFEDPGNGLLVLTFLVTLTFSSYVFTRIGPWLGVAFLINPMVIELVVAQVRSAVACGLCLVALTLRKKWLLAVLLVAASLIHSLTFIFAATFALAKLLERQRTTTNGYLLGLIALLCGVAFALILGFRSTSLLSAVDDRRASLYGVYSQGDTAVYCMYWLFLSLALVATTRTRAPYWQDYYATFMLAVPFFLTFFSIPGSRFVPLAFPLVLESVVARPPTVRAYIVTSMLGYEVLQYMYWLPKFF